MRFRSSILFLLFLRGVARFFGDEDLAQSVINFVIFTVALVVGGIVLGIVAAAVGSILALLWVLGITVGAITCLVWHLRLIRGARDLIPGRAARANP